MEQFVLRDFNLEESDRVKFSGMMESELRIQWEQVIFDYFILNRNQNFHEPNKLLTHTSCLQAGRSVF